MVKNIQAKEKVAPKAKEPEVISEQTKEVILPPQSKLKSKKKDIKLILVVGLIVLVLLIGLFYFYSTPTYRFSFMVNGSPFVSNEYTPSEFFKEFKDSNNFIVSVDLVDGNATPWEVNSLNLWLIALNADKKTVASLVKTIDSKGNLNNCITNDANVLVSRTLSAEECNTLVRDYNGVLVEIKKSSEDVVFLSKNKLEIRASSGKIATALSNASIKQFYPNFEDLLNLINEKIGSIS